MSRRQDVMEAALQVVSDAGLKGLTHRAVDARAGLPPGSSANLFRSRDSLIEAILVELEHRDFGIFDVDAGLSVRTSDDLAFLLARGVERMLAPENAALTRVRLTMMLAYPFRARPMHERMLAPLRALLVGCGIDGAEGRARLVAALLDGALLHELTISPGALDQQALVSGIRQLLGESEGTRGSRVDIT